MDVVETDVVIQSALQGKNIIISGSAGTGKSTLTRAIIKALEDKRVIVVAPTGLAASMVGGTTIHRQFGLKVNGGFDLPGKTILKELSKVDVVIVDEISMVRADIFDYMNVVMQAAKLDLIGTLFGGAQIICVGDLHQLSPVLTKEEKPDFNAKGYMSTFFFDAKCFHNSDFLKYNLTKNWRQSTDTAFVEILEEIKYGKLSPRAKSIINSKVKPEEDAMYLCSLNVDAEIRNMKQLALIPSQRYDYKARISGFFADTATNMLKILPIKVGAKVIMLNNDTDGRWFNGTPATIIGLEVGALNGTITIELQDGLVYKIDRHKQEIGDYKYDAATDRMKLVVSATFEQFPMKLGYAMSIHSSQGQTYDRVHINFGKNRCFSHGQAYVAFSRCRTLDGITMERPVKESDLVFDTKVIRFLNSV